MVKIIRFYVVFVLLCGLLLVSCSDLENNVMDTDGIKTIGEIPDSVLPYTHILDTAGLVDYFETKDGVAALAIVYEYDTTSLGKRLIRECGGDIIGVNNESDLLWEKQWDTDCIRYFEAYAVEHSLSFYNMKRASWGHSNTVKTEENNSITTHQDNCCYVFDDEELNRVYILFYQIL